MQDMKNTRFALLFVALLLLPSTMMAQLQRSQDFKGKYQLKEVVILSRHNIRAPLSDNGSALGRLTPMPGPIGHREPAN